MMIPCANPYCTSKTQSNLPLCARCEREMTEPSVTDFNRMQWNRWRGLSTQGAATNV